MAFAVGELVETVRWTYPEKTVVLHFFRCRVTAGAIAPQEGQLMEWVAPADFRRLRLSARRRELCLHRLEAGRMNTRRSCVGRRRRCLNQLLC